MLEQLFVQLLILLAAAVAVVGVFQRLHVPSSLGYLLVGVFLGPYTPGPVIEGHQLRVLAEFGIVFLLFTIGLSFSLPQIHALRQLAFRRFYSRPGFLVRQLFRLRNRNDLRAALSGIKSLFWLWTRDRLFGRKDSAALRTGRLHSQVLPGERRIHSRIE